MVQGGLLTTHPGSVHGGGEAPGGGSPLRQGAGKSSPDAPDLGSVAAAEQRRDREKGFRPRGFRDERNIYAKGGSQRRRGGPRRPPGAARGGAAPGGCLGHPRLPSGPALVFPEAPDTLIFPVFFSEFLGHF